MNAQRIESGTPEGEALGFVESLYSGWLELRETTGSTFISSFPGTKTAVIPRL